MYEADLQDLKTSLRGYISQCQTVKFVYTGLLSTAMEHRHSQPAPSYLLHDIRYCIK